MEYSNPNDNWYNHPEDNRPRGTYKLYFYYIIVVILLVVAALLLSSCKSIQYVPVETVKTEYVTKTDTFLQKDSIVFHDSVCIHSKGDTVWYEKWHTKYKDRIVTKVVIDSFIRTDSIQVPYPVEKKLTKYQQLKMDWGGTAIMGCLVLLALWIVFLVRIFKKRLFSFFH